MISTIFQRYRELKRYTTYERKPFFELVKPFTQGKEVIVDIGPGTDAFAKIIQRSDVYLLEGNEQSFLTLQRSFPNTIHYHAPDPLPFQDGSVHLIHISHLIEHLAPKNCYQLLKEIDRVLTPGGILALSTPSLYSDFYNDLSHVKPYNPAVFLKYLVWGNTSCTTRPIISNRFVQTLLVHRYAFRPFRIIGSKFITLDMIGYLIHRVISVLRLGTYEKTGYTLILTKR